MYQKGSQPQISKSFFFDIILRPIFTINSKEKNAQNFKFYRFQLWKGIQKIGQSKLYSIESKEQNCYFDQHFNVLSYNQKINVQFTFKLIALNEKKEQTNIFNETIMSTDYIKEHKAFNTQLWQSTAETKFNGINLHLQKRLLLSKSKHHLDTLVQAQFTSLNTEEEPFQTKSQTQIKTENYPVKSEEILNKKQLKINLQRLLGSRQYSRLDTISEESSLSYFHSEFQKLENFSPMKGRRLMQDSSRSDKSDFVDQGNFEAQLMMHSDVGKYEKRLISNEFSPQFNEMFDCISQNQKQYETVLFEQEVNINTNNNNQTKRYQLKKQKILQQSIKSSNKYIKFLDYQDNNNNNLCIKSKVTTYTKASDIDYEQEEVSILSRSNNSRRSFLETSNISQSAFDRSQCDISRSQKMVFHIKYLLFGLITVLLILVAFYSDSVGLTPHATTFSKISNNKQSNRRAKRSQTQNDNRNRKKPQSIKNK